MNTQNGCRETLFDLPFHSVSTDCGGVEIAENWVDRIAVIAVGGDLDALTAPQLTKAIEAAARKAPAAVIVDLSRTNFLAVAGMNALVTAHRDVTPVMRFGVVADGPATSRPLRKLGIDSVLPVSPSLVDALADFV